jgi:nicotinamide-nucleotide amidase
MGVPEAELELKMRGLERPGLDIGFRTKLPENQIKLIFSPEVEEAERQRTVAEARARVGPAAFGVDCGDLAEVVGHALAERGQTVALAESCTAGRLCAWLGAVPGASRYLLEGSVVYSNEAKTRTAGVPAEMIAEHGAVSEPVARALAEGMRARAGATWGLGITGIAGPGGGTADKPVGTVHLAVAGAQGTEHRLVRLPGDRDRITSLAAAAALSMLWRAMNPAAETARPLT